MSTHLLGIDVSKRTNVCCLVDSTGAKLATISVANSRSGSQELETWLIAQAAQYTIEHLAIATEATSFYDFHLIEFLAKSSRLASLSATGLSVQSSSCEGV